MYIQKESALRKLAAVSDVVIENFKRGDLDKMGVGQDALRQINPLGYSEACVKRLREQGVI